MFGAKIALCEGLILVILKSYNMICDSMDGPREHYAKWNKPVRERQIPYDFIHIWNLMNKLNYKENGDRFVDGEQDDN